MKYYSSIKDNNGFIHSIDNVVFEFYIKSYNMDRVAKELIEIRENNGCDGWEKINCPACSKYSWYQNIVHIGAIHISFGKMQLFDKISRSWVILPKLRIEVNPNKHHDEKVFSDILNWIRQNCTDGVLKKYDYAIDVPFEIQNIIILNSRKEKGLYKGTIYRGQRSKHGFLKIYDKAKESGSEDTLTRIEYTFEHKKELSFEHINIINTKIKTDSLPQLDNLNACIVSLCLALQSFDAEFEPLIEKLNYRRRKTLEPYLHGNSIELVFDQSILDSLLEQIEKLFDADGETNINEDIDGFIEIDDDIELPFE